MVNWDAYVEPIQGQDEDVHRFGGKAASLNALVRLGMPVPRAFCITVPAFLAFLEEIDLERNIRKYEELDAEACAAIQELIVQADLPVRLQDNIIDAYKALGGGAVAVRSSAIGEDSTSQSFAGQFETFLNVSSEDAVLTCVKRCWASLWAHRVSAYGPRHFGGEVSENSCLGMAVIIQEMIEPDTAGVLFTADPITGNIQRTVIDASWGVGEGVVSNQAVTDTYVVDSHEFAVVETTVRPKSMMSVCKGSGGISTVEVPGNRVLARTLTDQQAIDLARQAQAARASFGQDLDIEWAFQGDRLFVLQARPITVTGMRTAKRIYADPDETDDIIRENAMFSRMDTGEIVTGLMTPLGLSFCRFYHYHIHGPSSKRIGLLKLTKPQHFMGYLQGHVYLDISASAYMLTQCPPTRDPINFTKRYATDDVDLTTYRNPYGEPARGLTFLKSSLYWFGCQIRNMVTAEHTVRKAVALREREVARFKKLDLERMSLQELDAELKCIDRAFLWGCAAYLPFALQMFGLYTLLSDLCQKWLGERGCGLQNRIKASMNNLRTIEVTKAISDLANQVNESPSLRSLILETPLDRLGETLRSSAVGREFWNHGFAELLSEFGTRGRQEFELTIPRWADDPTYLLQVIRMYLVNDFDLDAQLVNSDHSRTKDTQALLATLPLKQRIVLKFIIAAYGKVAERREQIRPTFVAQTWFYRKIIIEVVRRLSEQGVLDMADLPYVDFNELRDYVAGRKPAEVAFSKELLERNRQQHFLNLRAKEPPLSIIGGYTPDSSDDASPTDPDEDAGIIRGLAASPGVVVARARVITDLYREAEDLERGEILVAKVTDASWTPLFVLAAGVVADIGSTLSHSSIVAREFGIPAVVNTRCATQKIKNGDLLYIDGSSGIVRIEERQQKCAVDDIKRKLARDLGARIAVEAVAEGVGRV